MERASCCSDHTVVKKGPWTPAEDQKLVDYVKRHGHGNWRTLPRRAGLLRCGKSCRLRWTNYLRPDIKRGKFSESEEQAIIQLHALLGNKWSTIAARLPGRTDNEIKNHWNTRLKKRLAAMGIDPHTHLPKVYGSLDSSTASSIGNYLAQLDNVPTVEPESAKLSETESSRLITADRIHRQWNACHLLNRRLQLSNGVMCGGVNSCLQRDGDNATSILKNTPKQDEVGLLLHKEDALRQEKLPKCKSIRVSDFTDDYDLILSTWQGTCTYMFSTSYNAFDSHHTISYPWPEDRLSAVAENIWKPMPSFASSSSKINTCNGVDSRVIAPGMKSDFSAVNFSPSCEQIVSEYGQNTGDLYCEITGSATETKWPQKAGASGLMWPHLDYEDANNCYPHGIDYNIN